jgi:FSR family fosmidomycin resistance protein-like MFS transporter
MQTSIDKADLGVVPSVLGTAAKPQLTLYSVLGAISFSHLLNDMIQTLILAI